MAKAGKNPKKKMNIVTDISSVDTENWNSSQQTQWTSPKHNNFSPSSALLKSESLSPRHRNNTMPAAARSSPLNKIKDSREDVATLERSMSPKESRTGVIVLASKILTRSALERNNLSPKAPLSPVGSTSKRNSLSPKFPLSPVGSASKRNNLSPQAPLSPVGSTSKRNSLSPKCPLSPVGSASKRNNLSPQAPLSPVGSTSKRNSLSPKCPLSPVGSASKRNNLSPKAPLLPVGSTSKRNSLSPKCPLSPVGSASKRNNLSPKSPLSPVRFVDNNLSEISTKNSFTWKVKLPRDNISHTKPKSPKKKQLTPTSALLPKPLTQCTGSDVDHTEVTEYVIDTCRFSPVHDRRTNVYFPTNSPTKNNDMLSATSSPIARSVTSRVRSFGAMEQLDLDKEIDEFLLRFTAPEGCSIEEIKTLNTYVEKTISIVGKTAQMPPPMEDMGRILEQGKAQGIPSSFIVKFLEDSFPDVPEQTSQDLYMPRTQSETSIYFLKQNIVPSFSSIDSISSNDLDDFFTKFTPPMGATVEEIQFLNLFIEKLNLKKSYSNLDQNSIYSTTSPLTKIVSLEDDKSFDSRGVDREELKQFVLDNIGAQYHEQCMSSPDKSCLDDLINNISFDSNQDVPKIKSDLLRLMEHRINQSRRNEPESDSEYSSSESEDLSRLLSNSTSHSSSSEDENTIIEGYIQDSHSYSACDSSVTISQASSGHLADLSNYSSSIQNSYSEVDVVLQRHFKQSLPSLQVSFSNDSPSINLESVTPSSTAQHEITTPMSIIENFDYINAQSDFTSVEDEMANSKIDDDEAMLTDFTCNFGSQDREEFNEFVEKVQFYIKNLSPSQNIRELKSLIEKYLHPNQHDDIEKDQEIIGKIRRAVMNLNFNSPMQTDRYVTSNDPRIHSRDESTVSNLPTDPYVRIKNKLSLVDYCEIVIDDKLFDTFLKDIVISFENASYVIEEEHFVEKVQEYIINSIEAVFEHPVVISDNTAVPVLSMETTNSFSSDNGGVTLTSSHSEYSYSPGGYRRRKIRHQLKGLILNVPVIPVLEPLIDRYETLTKNISRTCATCSCSGDSTELKNETSFDKSFVTTSTATTQFVTQRRDNISTIFEEDEESDKEIEKDLSIIIDEFISHLLNGDEKMNHYDKREQIIFCIHASIDIALSTKNSVDIHERASHLEIPHRIINSIFFATEQNTKESKVMTHERSMNSVDYIRHRVSRSLMSFSLSEAEQHEQDTAQVSQQQSFDMNSLSNEREPTPNLNVSISPSNLSSSRKEPLVNFLSPGSICGVEYFSNEEEKDTIFLSSQNTDHVVHTEKEGSSPLSSQNTENILYEDEQHISPLFHFMHTEKEDNSALSSQNTENILHEDEQHSSPLSSRNIECTNHEKFKYSSSVFPQITEHIQHEEVEHSNSLYEENKNVAEEKPSLEATTISTDQEDSQVDVVQNVVTSKSNASCESEADITQVAHDFINVQDVRTKCEDALDENEIICSVQYQDEINEVNNKIKENELICSIQHQYEANDEVNKEIEENELIYSVQYQDEINEVNNEIKENELICSFQHQDEANDEVNKEIKKNELIYSVQHQDESNDEQEQKIASQSSVYELNAEELTDYYTHYFRKLIERDEAPSKSDANELVRSLASHNLSFEFGMKIIDSFKPTGNLLTLLDLIIDLEKTKNEVLKTKLSSPRSSSDHFKNDINDDFLQTTTSAKTVSFGKTMPHLFMYNNGTLISKSLSSNTEYSSCDSTVSTNLALSVEEEYPILRRYVDSLLKRLSSIRDLSTDGRYRLRHCIVKTIALSIEEIEAPDVLDESVEPLILSSTYQNSMEESTVEEDEESTVEEDEESTVEEDEESTVEEDENSLDSNLSSDCATDDNDLNVNEVNENESVDASDNASSNMEISVMKSIIGDAEVVADRIIAFAFPYMCGLTRSFDSDASTVHEDGESEAIEEFVILFLSVQDKPATIKENEIEFLTFCIQSAIRIAVEKDERQNNYLTIINEEDLRSLILKAYEFGLSNEAILKIFGGLLDLNKKQTDMIKKEEEDVEYFLSHVLHSAKNRDTRIENVFSVSSDDKDDDISTDHSHDAIKHTFSGEEVFTQRHFVFEDVPNNNSCMLRSMIQNKSSNVQTDLTPPTSPAPYSAVLGLTTTRSSFDSDTQHEERVRLLNPEIQSSTNKGQSLDLHELPPAAQEEANPVNYISIKCDENSQAINATEQSIETVLFNVVQPSLHIDSRAFSSEVIDKHLAVVGVVGQETEESIFHDCVTSSNMDNDKVSAHVQCSPPVLSIKGDLISIQALSTRQASIQTLRSHQASCNPAVSIKSDEVSIQALTSPVAIEVKTEVNMSTLLPDNLDLPLTVTPRSRPSFSQFIRRPKPCNIGLFSDAKCKPWNRSLSDRTADHSGYSKIEKKYLYAITKIVLKIPTVQKGSKFRSWEKRPIKQHFLRKDCIEYANWFGELTPGRINKRFSPPFCELKVFAMSVKNYKQPPLSYLAKLDPSLHKSIVKVNLPLVKHPVLLTVMNSNPCITSNGTQLSGDWEISNDEGELKKSIKIQSGCLPNSFNRICVSEIETISTTLSSQKLVPTNPVNEIAEIGTIRTLHVKEDKMNRIHYMYNSTKKNRRNRFS